MKSLGVARLVSGERQLRSIRISDSTVPSQGTKGSSILPSTTTECEITRYSTCLGRRKLQVQILSLRPALEAQLDVRLVYTEDVTGSSPV